MDKTLLETMQEGVGIENEPDRPSADAAESVTNYDSGFAIRFCEGPRSFLNWQAGVLITERRWMPAGKGSSNFDWVHVSIYRLLGYGSTQSEAVEMARQNEHGRIYARR